MKEKQESENLLFKANFLPTEAKRLKIVKLERTKLVGSIKQSRYTE